ncbi:hypothetical protein BY996DRAFT_6597756 [Phakopsora pachyrhizi]|nr:hypothetical protein BY996DRAFT_6597756 [Phakopsora pachyrhizi]
MQDQLKEHQVQEEQASLCPKWMQSTHNHEPAPAISGLSTHRRYDPKELEMIHNLPAVWAPPKQILSTLKKTREDINEPDTGAILKDRSGRTPLEHLYYELNRRQHGFKMRLQARGSGKLQDRDWIDQEDLREEGRQVINWLEVVLRDTDRYAEDLQGQAFKLVF